MQLKDWIVKNNMTPAQLADTLGYQRNYVYKVMKGNQIPGRKFVMEVEKLTAENVKASDMGAEDPKPQIFKCPCCGRTRKIIRRNKKKSLEPLQGNTNNN